MTDHCNTPLKPRAEQREAPDRTPRNIRGFAPLSLRLLCTALLINTPVLAQDAPLPGAAEQRSDPITGEEITPETRQAIENGLAFLSTRQNPDGSFGGGGGVGASSAITALSALAFMSAGNLPGRGLYGDNVARAVDAILDAAQPSGLLSDENAHGVMYSHGFAALFLGEVYGMTGDPRIKEVLKDAVELIQKSQNHEGGWRYQPAPVDADISVTICQVMALRAARDAGINVDREVIDKAIEYVKNCQTADGGFSYMLAGGRAHGGSAFPRSAAGLASLYYAGISEGPEVERALQYLLRNIPGGNNAGMQAHYYYGHYYAAQAAFLAGGEWWGRWYPAIREELIARQNPTSGAWSGEVNNEYATAMALIILQMPNRYLPVFSGKGPGS
ncbi:MAG: prenyltransferase/squalene oxidase repeat-containing protein [Planctomycetota bacterium]